jgi:predicted nucleic acid-binding protein
VSRSRGRVRETRVTRAIIDASVAVAWVTTEPATPAALRLLRGSVSLLAPRLMAIESANALWKKSRRGDVGGDDVVKALATLHAVGIQWIDEAPLVLEATRLGLDIGHPVYDCLYLVVAQAHGVPLATFDERLRRAAGLTGVTLFPMKGRA